MNFLYFVNYGPSCLNWDWLRFVRAGRSENSWVLFRSLLLLKFIDLPAHRAQNNTSFMAELMWRYITNGEVMAASSISASFSSPTSTLLCTYSLSMHLQCHLSLTQFRRTLTRFTQILLSFNISHALQINVVVCLRICLCKLSKKIAWGERVRQKKNTTRSVRRVSYILVEYDEY